MRSDFKIGSNDNTLFTTARCNNNCIMCCQPPMNNDDVEELFYQNIKIIDRAPKGIPVVGISGGEPTLLGEKLIELIRHIREKMPDSDIHVLTNGRNFKDGEYAEKVVEAGEGKLFFGVPLHSDYYRDHDIIAGAKEAFNETIAGLYNLAAFGACIELRVVINKLNYQRLPQMSEFIHKNLAFVVWTAFMGMEHIGHAASNERNIWVEPIDYAKYLEEAILTLAQWRKEVAVYNIPLCLLPNTIHQYAQKSISDWKNKFLTVCDGCSLKDKCCGFFCNKSQTI